MAGALNLLIFCDGTWNTPDQMDDGLPAPTNVVKLRNALEKLDADGGEQRSYYHPGVGTDGGWWDRIAGGGLGEGLDKNIMSAYNWLVRNYEDGARIWVFGFSRGAYTVRSLGGLISRCGLLDVRGPGLKGNDKAIWAAIGDLFANYRLPEDKALPVMATADRPFRNVKAGQPTKHSMPIYFMGVWDTVGALGVPDDMALLNLIDDPAKHQFHDTELSPVIVNARHAVAIDERRESFTPTLWSNVAGNENVKQIWFPGVHADVGGGYGRCGLSDGALAWMMEEAKALGLRCRKGVERQLSPDASDQLHDSVTGVFKALKTLPRAVPQFAKTDALLHKSALDRFQNPPIQQGAYWEARALDRQKPVKVDVFAREQWNFTGIFLEAGVNYRLEATGEWIDGSIPCGPAGTTDGTFHLGEAVQMASSFLGKFETAYRKITGNSRVDFWYTKREEELDWFALVGVIANGELRSTTDKAGSKSHQTFLIGAHCSVVPTKSGYLYAFANDAWQAYANNRGSVTLSVSRA